jgi:hypothetical protein
MYSATYITTTPDNRILIESPHSTSAIVKDVETTDILKLSAVQNLLLPSDCPMEVSTRVLLPSWPSQTNPTPPEKTDAAIQGDIIDFQHYGWMAHYMEGLQTPLLFYRMEVIVCWWW